MALPPRRRGEGVWRHGLVARRRRLLVVIAAACRRAMSPAHGPRRGRRRPGERWRWSSTTRTIRFRATLADFYAGKRGIPTRAGGRLECSDRRGNQPRRIRRTIAGPLRRGVRRARLVDPHAGPTGRGAVQHRHEQPHPFSGAHARASLCASGRPPATPATPATNLPRSGTRTAPAWTPNSPCSESSPAASPASCPIPISARTAASRPPAVRRA